MNQQIPQKLNNLNKEFYQKIAEFFDSSRQYNWEGWEREEILSELHSREPLKVLDLGCGNGRYFKALSNAECRLSNYLGLDFTVELIDKTNEIASLGSQMLIKTRETDILMSDWVKDLNLENEFNVAVSFGVLHHIPSIELRQQFFRNVKKVLDKDGVFIFTVWNFAGSERQKNKVLDKSEYSKYGVEPGELDENDYLLKWSRGVEAVRYSHAYTDEEIQNLIQNSKFKIQNSFLADGKEGDLNRYYIVC